VSDGGTGTSDARRIATARLVLRPLRVDDADTMTVVLSSPDLYRFTGGEPPNITTLRARYTMQVEGSLDEDEEWMNWIICLGETGEAIGFLQATIDVGLDMPESELAWLVQPEFQRQGFATEAACGLAAWLGDHRPGILCAKIHPEHVASQLVATALGLRPTGEFDEADEELWTNRPH